MSVAEGFHTVATACVRHFRLNEPIFVGSRNSEALHQARVAMRRLRSALTLFRPAIADGEFEQIRDALRSFTAELGDSRNLDVLLQPDLPERERERLERKRECAYDSLIAAMESPCFRLLMLDLAAWTELGEWRRNPIAGTPLEPFLNRRIHRLWKRVARARRLGAMDEGQQHRLRIGIKKLRYGLEFAAALHRQERGRQRKFAKALKEIQEVLGYFHDHAVARMMLAVKNWPAAPPRKRRHLRDAKYSLRQLRRIGPYWR